MCPLYRHLVLRFSPPVLLFTRYMIPETSVTTFVNITVI